MSTTASSAGEVRSVSSTGAEKGVKPQNYSLVPSIATIGISLAHITPEPVEHQTTVDSDVRTLGVPNARALYVARARLYLGNFWDQPEGVHPNGRDADLLTLSYAVNSIQALWALDVNHILDTEDGALFDVLVPSMDYPYSSVIPLVSTFLTTEMDDLSGKPLPPGIYANALASVPEDTLRALAEHYQLGAAKYSSHNWRKGYEWSKSYSASRRHFGQFLSGQRYDEEMGTHHLIAAIWHLVTLLHYAANPQFYLDANNGESLDDRPRKQGF